MNPTEYRQSLGMKTQNFPTEVKHYWSSMTINKILDRQEYIGDTINIMASTRMCRIIFVIRTSIKVFVWCKVISSTIIKLQ